jgi:cytosine/adenosine deaminase-related metal-dependent hydrolase
MLVAPGDWVADGGLVLAGGRVARVLRSPSAVRRAGTAGVLELEGLVIPGLVDAHAHLELGGLGAELPGGGGFTAWVGALLAARGARSPAALRAGARRDAARLLATGTTAIGDVDTTGAGLAAALARRASGPPRPRVVLYREVLDAWDPRRTAAALAGVRCALRRRVDLVEGISPHAPFTASPDLLRAAAALARRRSLPIAVHWSESEDERAWLERGDGPLARVLPPGPRRAGLDLLAEAGLLGPRTALIHGNLPRRGEPARIARAGASVVHCPGCHAFFGRAPFPLERYLRAGVPLALGTDSRASNADLDMRREMALLRASAPGLSPERVLAMATAGGARALGLGAEIGALCPGLRADLVAFDVRARGRRAALDELTAGRPDVLAVLVGGRAALREPG